MTRRARQLAQLAQLAQLRRSKSAASLAKRQAVVAALEQKIAALREVQPAATTDIDTLVAQDRHDTWRMQQLVKLSSQLALAQAAAQPFREAHARDVARDQVIERLTRKSR